MEQTTVPKWEMLERLRDGDGKPVEKNVRMTAALLGPGYRGRRAELTDEERAEAAGEVKGIWLEAGFGPPPAYLAELAEGQCTHWRDRRAKLFEAGAYDDKELSASQVDVHHLAAGFEFPVPVLIEHVENPLRLGYLTHVEAAGPELFGLMAITPEADELLEESGARSLSLSVSKDLKRIYEVSIVGNPRIESARLFCANFTESPEPRDDWKGEAARLKELLDQQHTQLVISQLVRSGALPPSAQESAAVLLSQAKKRGIESELFQFLHSLPRTCEFGEIVPSKLIEQQGVAGEEADFYAKHFPDINLNEILKRKVK